MAIRVVLRVSCAVLIPLLAAACGTPREPRALTTAQPSTFDPTAGPTATLTPTTPPEKTFGPFASESGIALPKPADGAREGRVVDVTDGDTVVISGIDVGEVHASSGGRKARLIGIDTPEVFGGAECYGAQASAFTKRHLLNAQVLVGFDVEHTDRYGRALVYVWQADGRFFNGRLAAEGYALQLTIPPNVEYADVIFKLAREAREEGRGLWSACSEPEPVVTERPVYQPPPPPPTEKPTTGGNCHSSYPDFCIPPPPPDLDCKDIGRSFTVRWDVAGPDPHRFDADHDNQGCDAW